MRVEVDFGLCESNGVCMGLVPKVFDLRDDDVVIVLKSEVRCEEEDAVREAVRQCPRQAMSLVDPTMPAMQ